MEVTQYCYAKVNLFLEVLDKRPDGYHDLFTLFQKVKCYDQLSAEQSSSLILEGGDGITQIPEENLIIKAAILIKKQFQVTSGIKFTLNKKLPVGAGLGGGSANAAMAIKLCNTIWKLNLPIETLIEIGAKLGADVPFFLYKGTAFATGIGEQLYSAPPPCQFYLVIATPKCFVSTEKAYAGISPNKTPFFKSFQQEYQKKYMIPSFYACLKNDFEDSILAQNPQIKLLHDSISSFKSIKTLLCGSGASVFGLFEEKSVAQACESAIRSECRFSCVTEFQD